MPEDLKDQQDFEALWSAWDEFFTAVNRARGSAAREHGEALTVPQYRLLKAVSESPEARSAELANHLGVSAPTTTRMLAGLERDGIVRRSPSVGDRRCIRIELTERGTELLERKEATIHERRQAIFESLTPEEREQAQHLLKRLAEAIEAL